MNKIRNPLTNYGKKIKKVLDSKMIYQAEVADAYGMDRSDFSKMLRGLRDIPKNFTNWFCKYTKVSDVIKNKLVELENE